MIPVCMHSDASLVSSDGLAARLLACDPSRPDPERVYLVMDEQLAVMRRDCAARGVPAPAVLGWDRLGSSMPQPLAGFWRMPQPAAGPVRVCLINGGGGGIGDGIMMAPALERALELMRTACGADVGFDVYSAVPARTGAALRGIPGLRVLSMPLTLARFYAYHWFADLSGMMNDPDFSRMHMTDYALSRLGISPELMDAAAKEPRLRLAPIEPELGREIVALRRRAGDRPLVALVFTATRTRAMPDAMAADLFRLLASWCMPVVLMADAAAARAFIERYGLDGLVADLSPFSRDIAAYFSIIAALDCVVSVDTSAAHVAGALRRPAVALFNTIDHRLRTRYYRSVVPVQVAYRGKNCQAPCGLSKARFVFADGDGRPLFDLGYACPEALDIEGLGAEMKQMLAAGRRPAEVKAAFAPVFQASRAPCWGSLNLEQVDAIARRMASGQRPSATLAAGMEA